VVVILFLALTTPVGAHCIARAAYLSGERMVDPGARDEWAQHPEADDPPGSPGDDRPEDPE
jgi:multisubunit Na+/H+ antiporter MnhG subunit